MPYGSTEQLDDAVKQILLKRRALFSTCFRAFLRREKMTLQQVAEDSLMPLARIRQFYRADDLPTPAEAIRLRVSLLEEHYDADSVLLLLGTAGYVDLGVSELLAASPEISEFLNRIGSDELGPTMVTVLQQLNRLLDRL